MVKIFASSFILVLTIASVKAQTQTINIANYPKVNAVPDVNSPQVQAWLKELDLTGAPNNPVLKGAPPACVANSDA